MSNDSTYDRGDECQEPQADKAERMALGLILIKPNGIDEVAGILNPGHFRRSDHRAIYHAALDLRQRGDPVDLSTVTLELNRKGKLEDPVGGPSALTALADAADAIRSDSPRYYAGQITEAATRRTLISCASELSSNARGDLPVDTIIMLARNYLEQQALDALANKGQVIRSAAEEIDEYIETLRQRQGQRVYGLETGFPYTDELLNGLQAGLLVLAGVPGCGKTTLCKQLADEVARINDVPVLFFALDDAAEAQHLKTLSRLSHVSMREIKAGNCADKADKVAAAVDDYKAFGNRVFVVSGTGSARMTPQRIRLEAESKKNGLGAKRVLVVVDFLQNVAVEDPKAFSSDKERVDYICKELCHAAEALDSPILAVSQLNRQGCKSGEREVGDMFYFKETGGIEYSAFQAMELRLDEEETKKIQNAGRKNQRCVRLYVHKNRDGQLGWVCFTYTPGAATFEEDPDESHHKLGIDQGLLDFSNPF